LTSPPIEPESGQLDRVLVSGVAWVASARWTSQVLRWAATLFMAKLLLPSDYGIVGLSMILIGLVQQVAEFGLGSAVVQHRELTRDAERRLAGVALLIGAAMAVVAASSAPLVAAFFKQDALLLVVPVLSIRFVIDSLATIPRGLLNRALRFRELALIEAAESIVMAVVGLAAAFVWRSYWALVAANVVSGVVFALLANLRAPILPKWPRGFSELVPLLRFGRDVVISRLLWFWYTNSGFVVVGKLFSKEAVGAFTFAWSIAGMPAEKLASMIMSVVPGVFSSAKTRPGEMRRLFVGILQGIAVVTFPLSVGLALVAEPLVMNVFGAQWVDAVDPLRLLSLYFVFRVVSALEPVVLLARHETHIDRNFTAVFAVIMPIAFLIGARWGLVGVAAAWFVQPVISLPLQARYVWSKIGVTWGAWARALWPAASSAAVMSLFVLAVALLRPVQNQIGLLVIQVLVGGVSYVACLWFGHRSAAMTAIQLVARRKAPIDAAAARVSEGPA
jgi:O-antigen/teichoic acid export membrane protein